MGHADRALYRRAGACRSRSRTIDQRLGDDRDAVDRDPRSTQAHRARAVADRSASPYDPALRASSQEPGLAAGGRSQEMALEAAPPRPAPARFHQNGPNFPWRLLRALLFDRPEERPETHRFGGLSIVSFRLWSEQA